jgi:glucosamine--fructose-6-phosphate aminotransferase (isomerizing)
MCGIIGYVGKRDAQPILLNGLKRLEYRGYDSAGVVMVDSDQLHLRRSVGKVSGLEERLSQNPAPGQIGIAHTRWATHGGPSEINAHPHLDARDRVAIVHNGIIENHRAIRQFLEKQGVIF